jgi:hypothetical protein
MIKPKAETRTPAQRLSRYVELEADAVETYALAARRLRDLAAVASMGDFRVQHQAQRDELSRLCGEAGGERFDPFRARRPATGDWARLAARDDDGASLAVLRDGERARMNEYETGMRAAEGDAGVRNALERGYFGCLTRLRWLEARALGASAASAAAPRRPRALGSRRAR